MTWITYDDGHYGHIVMIPIHEHNIVTVSVGTVTASINHRLN